MKNEKKSGKTLFISNEIWRETKTFCSFVTVTSVTHSPAPNHSSVIKTNSGREVKSAEMQSKINAFFKPSPSQRPESPEAPPFSGVAGESTEEPEIGVSCNRAGSDPEG